MARIREAPDGFACVGRETFNDFLVSDAMVQREQVAEHRWAAVTGSGFHIPDYRRAVGGPAVKQVGLFRNSVGARTQKLRPIFSK